MVILFLLGGICSVAGGISLLFTSDCFDEAKKALVVLVVGVLLLLIPAMVPANEEIIECQVITTSIDIRGEKVVTDVPVKWTWKERSVNSFSYAFLKTGTFDYKAGVVE
jgi:hypothetical protein